MDLDEIRTFDSSKLPDIKSFREDITSIPPPISDEDVSFFFFFWIMW